LRQFVSLNLGHTVSELGYTIFGQPFLGSSDNAGFLYVKPTYQVLGTSHQYQYLCIIKRKRLERYSYDLEMKTREQNRNNKRTEIERFDWFTERMQRRVAFGWLSDRSDERTSCPRNREEKCGVTLP